MSKKPERICTVCREMKPKDQLIRVVKDPQGTISVDSTGKKPGRGAYICNDPECIGKAKQKHSLDRSLKAKVSNEVWQRIDQAIEDKTNESA